MDANPEEAERASTGGLALGASASTLGVGKAGMVDPGPKGHRIDGSKNLQPVQVIGLKVVGKPIGTSDLTGMIPLTS